MKAELTQFGFLVLTGETLDEQAFLRHIYRNQRDIRINLGSMAFDKHALNITFHPTSGTLRPGDLRMRKIRRQILDENEVKRNR